MSFLHAVKVVIASVIGSASLLGIAHAGTVIAVAPPRIIVERSAPPRSPGLIWVEGHWRWIGDRYVWISGRYIAARPGFRYVAPVWVPAPGGWRLVPGSWQRIW
jgi:hypothetical protein